QRHKVLEPEPAVGLPHLHLLRNTGNAQSETHQAETAYQQQHAEQAHGPEGCFHHPCPFLVEAGFVSSRNTLPKRCHAHHCPAALPASPEPLSGSPGWKRGSLGGTVARCAP